MAEQKNEQAPAAPAVDPSEVSDLKAQLAALQKRLDEAPAAPAVDVAALLAGVGEVVAAAVAKVGSAAPAEPVLDKNEELHKYDLYPHMKRLAGEDHVPVTCVTRRGVSTGYGEYLQPGQTSEPIPRSIADKLIDDGLVVEGDVAPSDLAERHALELARELIANGGPADADAAFRDLMSRDAENTATKQRRGA